LWDSSHSGTKKKKRLLVIPASDISFMTMIEKWPKGMAVQGVKEGRRIIQA
jgi:hypothetical protein